MKLALYVSLVSFLVACGGSSTTTQPPTCTGTSCSCPSGQACDIGTSACAGDSCSLNCSSQSMCSGSCGASCSIDCGNGSTCDVTVGESGSVSCKDGSTCHVQCTDSCSVSCAANANCDLTCPGDTMPKTITGGGSC